MLQSTAVLHATFMTWMILGGMSKFRFKIEKYRDLKACSSKICTDFSDSAERWPLISPGLWCQLLTRGQHRGCEWEQSGAADGECLEAGWPGAWRDSFRKARALFLAAPHALRLAGALQGGECLMVETCLSEPFMLRLRLAANSAR